MWPASKCRAWMARFAAFVLALACLMVVQTGTAFAAPPANDDFANATVISSLPFSDSGNLNGTTAEPGEPGGCAAQASQTVWYAFTPAASMVVKADVDGSDNGIAVNSYVASGSGFDNLQFLDCASISGSSYLAVEGGTTYYFQAVSVFAETANLQFHVQQLPPPPNDDFANATQVTTVPFSETVEHLIAATREPGEQVSCAGGTQTSTVWWAFTPTPNGISPANFGGPLSPWFDVYTGSSLADLHVVACSSGADVTFQATAGTTYYLRAGGMFPRDFPQTFRLDAAPPPAAAFSFSPSDPSVLDTVQFTDESSDPAGAGIQSQAWSFGDGATAEGCCPTHRYAQDGDYTVGLTVTTPDGRTGSTSQAVRVRTHEVAIVRIGVPNSAHVGQTIKINVSVRNTRQPETVQVDLFKTVPGGFQQVGSLTQSVPVKSGNRTTLFAFTNTITEADRSVGKVSFKAVATIIDHRDALPADNELTSPPVRVT
jgi:PKD domain